MNKNTIIQKIAKDFGVPSTEIHNVFKRYKLKISKNESILRNGHKVKFKNCKYCEEPFPSIKNQVFCCGDCAHYYRIEFGHLKNNDCKQKKQNQRNKNRYNNN